jgi:PadR family transcriptional regulator, regulatory protein PadR
VDESKHGNRELLKGTLDMMILRTLITGDAHGHTIAKVIERTSEDVLGVEEGSLYPGRSPLGFVVLGNEREQS